MSNVWVTTEAEGPLLDFLPARYFLSRRGDTLKDVKEWKGERVSASNYLFYMAHKYYFIKIDYNKNKIKSIKQINKNILLHKMYSNTM